jgi:hypothetical protein
MSLRIRRGTNADRLTITPDEGELIYVNTGANARKLYIGDGTTVGGRNIGEALAGNNLVWDNISQTLQSTASGGANLPPNALGFLRNDGAGSLSWTSTTTSVVADTNPSLGGNLNLNNKIITGTGSINITGSATVVGTLNNFGITQLGNLSNDSELIIYNRNSSYISLRTLADNTQFIEMTASNGTFAAPTPVVSQNLLGGLILRGWSGVDFKPSVIFGGQVDGAVVAGGVPGKFVIQTTNAAGTGTSVLTFDKNGKLAIPTVAVGDGTAGSPSIAFSADVGANTGFYRPGEGIVGVSINGAERARVIDDGMVITGYVKVKDFAGTLPVTPTAGMIVLDGSTFKGYNGTAWVDFN